MLKARPRSLSSAVSFSRRLNLKALQPRLKIRTEPQAGWDPLMGPADLKLRTMEARRPPPELSELTLLSRKRPSVPMTLSQGQLAP